MGTTIELNARKDVYEVATKYQTRNNVKHNRCNLGRTMRCIAQVVPPIQNLRDAQVTGPDKRNVEDNVGDM